MHALDVRGGRQIGKLRLHQSRADRYRPIAHAELMGEFAVDPFAVLDQLVVAVLEARPRDQRAALPSYLLSPVKRLSHAGDAFRIGKVVAGMAARAEHERVGQVDRGRGQLAGIDRGPVVGREERVRVEMAGQVHQVVVLWTQKLRPEVIGRPGAADQAVGGVARSGLELRLDEGGRVGQEVVTGHERGARLDGLHRAIRVEVGVDHPARLGGRLDQPADGEIRHREAGSAERQDRARPVFVLAEHVLGPQARLRR